MFKATMTDHNGDPIALGKTLSEVLETVMENPVKMLARLPRFGEIRIYNGDDMFAGSVRREGNGLHFFSAGGVG
jgi:hypothetical protein